MQLGGKDATPSAEVDRKPVFDHHLSENEAVQALQPFDVICTLRERTAFPLEPESDR